MLEFLDDLKLDSPNAILEYGRVVLGSSPEGEPIASHLRPRVDLPDDVGLWLIFDSSFSVGDDTVEMLLKTAVMMKEQQVLLPETFTELEAVLRG